MYNLDHLVPVPSLFFIGGNGVPLEVVAGEVNEPELLRRIASVLEKSGKAVSPGKILLTDGKSEEKLSVSNLILLVNILYMYFP
jgi:hypothetical protein